MLLLATTLAVSGGIALADTGFEWPNATNTGVLPDISRTTYSGSMTISDNNVTLQNLDIIGTLRVTGANCKLINCRITYDGWWGVDADGASGLYIEHCDVIGSGTVAGGGAIAITDGIIKNCKISGTENCIFYNGGNIQILHNYIFDLAFVGSDPHVDGIQTGGGADNVLIQDNWIESFDTSNIIIKTDFGPISNHRIIHNVLIADPNRSPPASAIYSVAGNAGDGAPTGTVIKDNIVQRGWNNFFSIDGTATVSENFAYDPNAPDFKGAPIS